MWKNNIIKLAYKFNSYLNAREIGNLRFVHDLKHRGKYLMIRLLAHNNLFLIKVDGLPMYIHQNSAEYLLWPYEPYTTELFKRTIKPGATVLDIGAQFGYFSLIAAKQAGQEGQIFAFEPVPGNFEILKRNIQVNNYTHIINPIQKAVGNQSEMVNIFLYKNSNSHAMYRHPQAAIKEIISVECITIDEFLGGQPVDIIKMDIEGNEPYALEGMKQTIAKSANLILFTELAPTFLRRAGVKPEDYLTQLNDLGFDVQLIDEHSRCLKPVTENFLSEGDPSRYANLYCTKNKRKKL